MYLGVTFFNIGKHFLVLAVLLPAIFSLLPSIVYAAWTTSVIDSSRDTYSMSIAVDGQGYAHLSYASDAGLRYAQFNGTDWIIQSLDGGGRYGSSIEVTSEGYARIAYEGSSTTVKYAAYNGTDWIIQTVQTHEPSLVTGFTALGVDAQGYGRIVYTVENAGARVAVYDGASWSMTEVNQILPSPDYSPVSIAVGTDGHARIVQNEQLGSGMVYSVFDGTNWDDEFTGSPENSYTSTMSLSLDGSNNPHISYYATGQDLVYLYKSGMSWISQTVDSAGDVGQSSSLVLDSQGYAYISYLAYTGSVWNIKLAHYNGTGWDLQTLATNVYAAGRESALAIYNDYVYVTFAQGSGDLVMMTNAPEGFVPEPAMNILGKILLFGLPVFIMRQRKRN